MSIRTIPVEWIHPPELDPEVKGMVRILEADGLRRFARDLLSTLQPDVFAGSGPVAASGGFESAHSRSAGVEKVVEEVLDPERSCLRLETVKQRPGQRAILRLELLSPSSRLVLYAKLYRKRRAERIPELETLARAAADIQVYIPPPLAWLDRFRSMILPEAPGRSLDQFSTMDEHRAAGHALAGLHQILPLVDKVCGPDLEPLRVSRVRQRMESFRPDLIPRFDSAVSAWAQASLTDPADAAGRARFVTIHGDLYPSQFLTSGSGVALLDWDEVCAGDPEQDVGNYVAHLHLDEARYGAIGNPAGSFLESYLASAPLEEQRLLWYLRGSLLRLAGLYSDPAFGPPGPRPTDLADTLLKKAAGPRCSGHHRMIFSQDTWPPASRRRK